MSLKGLNRFSTEIPLSIPDAPARKAILKSLDPPVVPDIRTEVLDKLGDRTHAYTAKDLVMLLSTAGKLAERRVDRTIEDWKEKNHYLSQDDIEQALLLVRPTAMHDITLKPPSVRWDDIGGQESVKKALRRAVETPLKVTPNSSFLNRSKSNFCLVPSTHETCRYISHQRSPPLRSSRLFQNSIRPSHGHRSRLQLLRCERCRTA
jgi:SpoVK/Ycf46/Vps4 family AAA+-type ATPase